MCNCDIICTCSYLSDVSVTIEPTSGGAWSLGRPRPLHPSTQAGDQLELFNINNNYKTYAYTLSPKSVGIMRSKSRDRQYQTLKKLHKEVLDNFECSYIINIEIYPGSDNDLHVHGVMRFRSHNKKELFKKQIKEKLTLGGKGSYFNLIDCEFVNSFDMWRHYIMKSQDYITSLGYYPFIKIDYSFHIPTEHPTIIAVPASKKTKNKSVKDPETEKNKINQKMATLMAQINNLKEKIKNL